MNLGTEYFWLFTWLVLPLVLDSVISNGAPTAELELEVTDHEIRYFQF